MGIRGLLRDVLAACRIFRSAPALAAIVVLSLGTGIGVNAAMFTWVQALVMNPLPGTSGAAALWLVEPRTESGTYPGASWKEYRDLEERLPAFGELFAARSLPLNLGDISGSERVAGQLVSGNFFSALGLSAASGRLIGPADAVLPRDRPVAVVSFDFWLNRLAGTTGAIGQHIRINDRPFTVVGVAPKGFYGSSVGQKFDLWVPATMAPVLTDGSRELESRTQRGYLIMGTLASGMQRSGAASQVEQAMVALARDYPESNRNITGRLFAFNEAPRGPNRMLLGSVLALQGLLLLLLLAVCGNTASLMLVRAQGRRREISTRLALGAGRFRIVRLLLAECLVLAMGGSAFGALVAVWGSTALRAVPMPSPGGMTLKFVTSVDVTTFGVMAMLGLGCGVLFGLPSALYVARTAPTLASHAGATVGGRNRLRDLLMAAEVALALVVLVMSAVFMKTFNDSRITDTGFRRDGVLLAAYDLRGRNRPADSDSSIAFADNVLERLRRDPAVASVAIASAVPLDLHGLSTRAFSVEGHTRADGALDQASTITVTPGYFGTMEIPFVEGGDFAGLRDPAAPPQAVVNQTFVARLLPGLGALGRRIDTAGREYTIVGVVRDSKYNSFGEDATPFIYLSYRDRPGPIGEFHVRPRSGDAQGVVPLLREAVRATEETVPIYNIRTLADHVDQNLVFARVPARIFAVLGPLLLVLAGIGIYGVVAYAVTQRTIEIGLRIALGAPARRIVGGLVSETLRVVGLGAGAGLILALAVNRYGSNLRFAGWVAAVFAGVTLVLFAVATFACWLPARRATRIDPLLALKQE